MRNLIGDAHWLSDGRHKEHLLTELVRRHLPGSMIAAPGFVIGTARGAESSREQDLLVLDTSIEAPIFYQGNLVVTFPSAVIASISVKTRMDKETIRSAVEGLNSVRSVVADHYDPAEREPLWCGAFFYEERSSAFRNLKVTMENIGRALCDYPVRRPIIPTVGVPGPDQFATAYNLVVRFAYDSDESGESKSVTLMPHDCEGLASSIFIARLLSHIATVRGTTHSAFAQFADTPMRQIDGGPFKYSF